MIPGSSTWIAEISDRTERNALDERYRLAMEAINPLREERWLILHGQAHTLGAVDHAEDGEDHLTHRAIG